jgi:hypothetical protein
LIADAHFGFVTGCHSGDKFMVQATLASIRHFCPEVPICLVADGDVDVSELEKQYGLIVLRTKALPDLKMRDLCCGSYYAKLSAMWEGPFDYGVWLDADAILWGDIRPKLEKAFDFYIFSCNGMSDLQDAPTWLTHYQHDPNLLKQFDPEFDWKRNPYFCSGTFAFRKNVVPFEMWLEVQSWRDQCSGLFGWGEMGMLNYCIHSLNQKGKIRVGISDLQHLRSEQGIDEFFQDLGNCGWHLPKSVTRPRVAHFCGSKPYFHNYRAYCKPFTIARLEHYRKTRGEFGAWAAVLDEERKILQKRMADKFCHKVFGP